MTERKSEPQVARSMEQIFPAGLPEYSRAFETIGTVPPRYTIIDIEPDGNLTPKGALSKEQFDVEVEGPPGPDFTSAQRAVLQEDQVGYDALALEVWTEGGYPGGIELAVRNLARFVLGVEESLP